MSRTFALCTTGLEVYAFYLVMKINDCYYNAIFYALLHYVYKIRRGIKKNFGQKLV